MIKYFKELTYKSHIPNLDIEINKIDEGLNLFENIIILRKSNNFKIYDRVCDHAGGKLIYKEDKLICPVHNWEFNPLDGLYKNGVSKKEVKFKIEKNLLKVNLPKMTPIITNQNKDCRVNIRFFNHAFLIVESDNIKFATDPWALGPAFNTGWWLKNKTKLDWVEELNSCDYIYISHNHPDHLHKQTLSYVRKDMNFIAPEFNTDSVGRYLEDLNFINIFRSKFGSEYKIIDSNMYFSIFKSGDFREDSGIYFSIGNFRGLIDVDSNNINFSRIPEVDFYASGLGGIASGFPIMYKNYNLTQKKDIIKINNKFQMIQKDLRVFHSNTKFYMPYAGFSAHILKRDKIVKVNNTKINPQDYLKICKKNNVKLLDVTEFDTYCFEGNKLNKSYNISQKYFNDLSSQKYLETFKKTYSKIDKVYIKNYFIKSNFKDNLILVISLTDDKFKKIHYEFIVDFTNLKIKYKLSKNFSIKNIEKNDTIKYLHLKVRKESFLSTIYNKEPWEDLSIGFQCLVERKPNLYNSNFWYFFTNKYITKKHVRASTNCNNCETLNHAFQNELKPFFNIINKN